MVKKSRGDEPMVKSFLIFALLVPSLFAVSPVWAQTAPVPVIAPAASDSYLLGTGDKLRITVYGEPELTGEYDVSSSGQVSLPLAGEVPAAGETVADFESRVVSAYDAGYLKDAKVSVEVLTFRPFFILGEVEKPGEYPYSAGLTVLNAVATAGGFTYRANNRKVFIKHNGDEKEQEYPLSSGTPISAGDTVRIIERYF